MKNLALFPVLAAALVFAPFAEAQSNGTNGNGATYVVTSRSANERQWSKVVSITNGNGVVTSVTNATPGYIERATGLCYQKVGDTNWSDAAPQIDIVADGAQSSGTRHSVHWLSNINAPGGAVHLVSPGGPDFRSRVYGLAYIDYTTGTNILLTGLQDSNGQTVGTNKVVYPNAFSNGITADVEYVNSQAGLEQNIILRSQLPSPTNFPGLNPQTTRLQVLSEFFSPPQATNRAMIRDGVQEDELISFGTNDMSIGMGRAMSIQGQTNRTHDRLGVVSKHWTKMGDSSRDFLIEEIPYRAISNAVEHLPPQASVTNSASDSFKNIASLLPLQQPNTTGAAKTVPMQIAKSQPDKPGVVVDYITYSGYDSPDFEEGMTYYISGAFYVDEGIGFGPGEVIKFDPSAGSIIYSDSGYAVQWWEMDSETNYDPAVFTSMNDDTVGEIIAGSTGSPGVSSQAYLIEYGSSWYSPYIPHAIFAWAQCAYEGYDTTSHLFADCQFIQCNEAIYVPDDLNLYLYNVLFAGQSPGMVAIEGAGYDSLTILAQQVTADSCVTTVTDDPDDYSCDGTFINSIFTDCDGSETNNSTLLDSVDYSDNSGVYELGQNQLVTDWTTYYLTSGSSLRGAGASAIASDLLTQIEADSTVEAQLQLSNYTTYSLQDGNYPDTGTYPDLGFHYSTDYSFYDGVPDSWELAHFGIKGIPGGYFDSPGSHTLLYDYQNSINPALSSNNRIGLTVYTPMQ